MIEVFSPKTKVKLVKDIEGLITSILINSKNDVCYKVVWWDGNTRKEEWVKDYEIIYDSYNKKEKIGFTKNE